MADDKPSKLLVVVVLIINTCAFSLAVAAERRRSSGRVVPDRYDETTYCVYDSDIACGYGIGAMMFVMASEALLMALTACLCCGSVLRPGGSRAWAIIFFFFSWLTFLTAEACLLAGAVRNAYHTKYRGAFGADNLSCQTLRKGVFAGGAALIVSNTIINVLYYMSFAKARSQGWKPYANANQPAVAMSSLPK